MNFNDTDYLCSRLIPENNFYRKFREIVEPLLKDEVFSSMYSADNGRPAISPALLSMATILQFYRNLTDREMERACMYDLEIKYALRLRVDDRPFDHSSLGDFRKRLLAHGKEKEIFDRILNKLVESGLIKRNEIQRIDATHVIADVAVPTMITLVKKCTREVLKSLKGQQKHIYKTLESKVDLEKYTRETVNKTDAGKEDVEKRKIKLLEVVTDAREVLKSVSKMNASRVLRKKVDLLKRIMQENLIEDENGHPVEMENKKEA